MKLAFYIGRSETNPSARLFDEAVCWWTRGPYSHVELVVEGPDEKAVCWSSSYRDGGVRRKEIDLTSGHWHVIELDESFDKLYALTWFDRHKGKPYDVAGLFGFVLPWRTENKKKWFCSESVAAALRLPDPWTCSPNSLFAYITQPGERYA